MNKDSLLLALIATFAPLSLMTIGGGVTVLADIQRAVVGHYHWFTDAGFLQIFAVSRVAPGPGTLLVTLIGWHIAGLAGALVATLAIFIPSSLLVLAVAYVWHRYPGLVWQKAVATGLAPIAAGLIIASVVSLLASARGGWIAWLAAGGVAAATFQARIGPIALLVLGASAYCLLSVATIWLG
ncbi:chromate transporter [Mangrovibrevibacter kandeliae]|uniref:chromate transporter n=1 Tax=Mangrovibrevibacter kandeliae TaxID=2968473 RepID=UPI002118183B|nr:chromate transporter [Aurantimonas sp. CSK15Z-1]